MKTLVTTLALFLAVTAFSQNDKLFLHNQKTVEGVVSRVNEFTVVFKYAGEDAEQTLSKYAVAKIVYGKSNREEQITDKIVVNSKEDWENVVILEDKSQIAGLSKVSEIKGKTATFYNFRSNSGNDRKSQQRLKEEAAELGCPFILMTADKDPSFWSKQSVKKGLAYKY